VFGIIAFTGAVWGLLIGRPMWSEIEEREDREALEAEAIEASVALAVPETPAKGRALSP